MTAEARTELPADATGAPSLTLDDAQLGDLELLLSGAFAPLAGFMGAADVAAVLERGTLADGTPWPVPVTLDVSPDAVPEDAASVLLTDAEGTPLAVLDIAERSEVQVMRPARHTGPGRLSGESWGGRPPGPALTRLSGQVTGLREPEHGPFRRLMRRPAEAREALGDGPVLAYATRGPVHGRQIGQLRHMAGLLKARLLLLPLVAGPAEVVTRPEALVRAVLAAAASLPPATMVIPVPLAPRRPVFGTGPAGELSVRALVAAAYGATHLMADDGPADASPSHDSAAGDDPGAALSPGRPIEIVRAGDWAYDPRAEVWRPLALIEAGAERGDLSPGELGDLLDAGAEVPAWFTPPAVARELRRARPPRAERGFVLFLTGLSGSGKSTIARNLRDALAERGDRKVSLLDGDLVRQLLSAGLTFSRADRDLNIVRIGFVAAEIARHGGIAICAPIAPYAQARAQVREMVSDVGDFLLIHVATPLEVCEARDRKGLYAKARAGQIKHFTGISDPYEEPTDADLTIDTSTMTREQATDAVLGLLTAGGWLSPAQG
ncbi:MAG TPA: adenylyl-sulfate kinase [Streptosporangiaceae bacterium]|nr:adenylyl-sulfate kinase [Streptosporangiaceae bacterium]